MLGAAAAAAGGTMIFGTRVFGADEEAESTDHFRYRLAPPGPHIDSQRGARAFGFSADTIYLSEDNGRTWPHLAAFPEARQITFSYLLTNGNILFATRNQLYLSTDRLKTLRPITVRRPDGSDYVPHTPQNPDLPGWYFAPLNGVSAWDVQGTEMLVWGNYCSVVGGAAPPAIYYSTDSGQTVKIAYLFGQNPYHRDNGTAVGGSIGTLLGDPDNPIICRHIHCVTYNPVEHAFYACTGDRDRAEGFECHWLRGTYDSANDTWDWKVLVSQPLNSRYKSGGINFVDGQLYWISDANGPEPHDRGVFRCAPADIADPAKHTRLFNPRYECANMIIQDGVILAGHYATASPFHTGIIVSPDLGESWAEYDLQHLGRRSPVRFQQKNAEGWFRVDLRAGWIERAEVLFIQPKSA
jgi:hypothetical protein